MDETYLRVKCEWVYLYRAIDKFGDTVDFMISEKRDEAAATAFFRQAIDGNGLPEKVVIDKSGSNNSGLENINMLLRNLRTSPMRLSMPLRVLAFREIGGQDNDYRHTGCTSKIVNAEILSL